MTAKYMRHRFGYAVHAVRWEDQSGAAETWCGKWYYTHLDHSCEVSKEVESELVCGKCLAARARHLGKKVYSAPVLQRGIAKVKQKRLSDLLAEHRERERLRAWNERAARN